MTELEGMYKDLIYNLVGKISTLHAHSENALARTHEAEAKMTDIQLELLDKLADAESRYQNQLEQTRQLDDIRMKEIGELNDALEGRYGELPEYDDVFERVSETYERCRMEMYDHAYTSSQIVDDLIDMGYVRVKWNMANGRKGRK